MIITIKPRLGLSAVFGVDISLHKGANVVIHTIPGYDYATRNVNVNGNMLRSMSICDYISLYSRKLVYVKKFIKYMDPPTNFKSRYMVRICKSMRANKTPVAFSIRSGRCIIKQSPY